MRKKTISKCKKAQVTNRLHYKVLYTLIVLFIFIINSIYAENIKLHCPGKKDLIDYSKYGKLKNVGTSKYRYQLKKRKNLMKDIGEGIYPNTSVFKDTEYIKLKKAGKLQGTQWNFVNNKNHKLNFYKWATCQESPGVKLYYTALMFERMGMLKEAIKAYHAIAVNFPKTVSYTYWESPIYLGAISLDKIEILCRRNPELGFKLIHGKITVKNGFDLEIKNDKFIINPGRIIKISPDKANEKKKKLFKNDIIKKIGGDHVKLVKYKNGHWQLLVDNKPYIIKAMAYSPNKVGLSPDKGTLDPTRDWQKQDHNKNGKIDGVYEAWIDKNNNNKQDTDEKTAGDAKLLKNMGCNTLRIYSHAINKKLFRDLYKKYNIMIMIGDMAGGYAIESGASWKDGTDYENPKQIKKMMNNIKEMVLRHKDEPYTLCWVLGNENVYGVGNNSKEKPEAFFKFINDAVKMVHKLDPDHPVAVCNGDLKYLDIIAKNAPDIDIFGANAYRGKFGFGRSMFETVLDLMDKPVIITEYGCSAYGEGFTKKEILQFQSDYHKNNWEDISYHSAGSGVGNSLGGVIFEWVDEWWKANSDLPKKIQLLHKKWYEKRSKLYKNLHPENQDTVPQFGAPFIDGWSYEEWYGLFSQGDGKHSPNMRQKRPVYDMYKEIWNKKD